MNANEEFVCVCVCVWRGGGYAWNHFCIFNKLFVRWYRSVVENLKVIFRSGFNPDTSIYVYIRKIMRKFGNSVRVLGITVDFFQRKVDNLSFVNSYNLNVLNMNNVNLKLTPKVN